MKSVFYFRIMFFSFTFHFSLPFAYVNKWHNVFFCFFPTMKMDSIASLTHTECMIWSYGHFFPFPITYFMDILDIKKIQTKTIMWNGQWCCMMMMMIKWENVFFFDQIKLEIKRRWKALCCCCFYNIIINIAKWIFLLDFLLFYCFKIFFLFLCTGFFHCQKRYMFPSSEHYFPTEWINDWKLKSGFLLRRRS